MIDGRFVIYNYILYLYTMENKHILNNYIYITNDEDIKVGDWVIDEDGILKCTDHAGSMNHYFSKIIETNDPALILDGVKSIEVSNDKDFQKKLQKGYERMSIVVCLWACILAPILFISNDNQFMLVITWMIWVILGILLSPKIVNKIWSK